MTITWNASDQESHVSLSTDALTLTVDPTYHGASLGRATVGRNSGKYYFELYFPNGGSYGDWDVGGIASGSASLTAIGSGQWVIYQNGFRSYNGSGGSTFINPVGYVGVAVDFDTGKLWIRVNGSSWLGADPSSGTPLTTIPTGDTYYPIGGRDATTFGGTTSVVLHTTTADFAYSAPTGFNPWDYTPSVPSEPPTILLAPPFGVLSPHNTLLLAPAFGVRGGSPKGSVFAFPPFGIVTASSGHILLAPKFGVVSSTGSGGIFAAPKFGITSKVSRGFLLAPRFGLVSRIVGGILKAPKFGVTGRTYRLGGLHGVIGFPAFGVNEFTHGRLAFPRFAVLSTRSTLRVPRFGVVSFPAEAEIFSNLAWVTNLAIDETVRWTDLPFMHILRLGTANYGLASHGLYKLEGVLTDDGRRVDAVAWLNGTAFEPNPGEPDRSAFLKRVPNLYVGVNWDIKVTPYFCTDHYENSGPYVSRVGAKRVDLGKGARGFYWSFKIENVDGGWLRIDGIEPVVQFLTRKVL